MVVNQRPQLLQHQISSKEELSLFERQHTGLRLPRETSPSPTYHSPCLYFLWYRCAGVGNWGDRAVQRRALRGQLGSRKQGCSALSGGMLLPNHSRRTPGNASANPALERQFKGDSKDKLLPKNAVGLFLHTARRAAARSHASTAAGLARKVDAKAMQERVTARKH